MNISGNVLILSIFCSLLAYGAGVVTIRSTTSVALTDPTLIDWRQGFTDRQLNSRELLSNADFSSVSLQNLDERQYLDSITSWVGQTVKIIKGSIADILWSETLNAIQLDSSISRRLTITQTITLTGGLYYLSFQYVTRSIDNGGLTLNIVLDGDVAGQYLLSETNIREGRVEFLADQGQHTVGFQILRVTADGSVFIGVVSLKAIQSYARLGTIVQPELLQQTTFVNFVGLSDISNRVNEAANVHWTIVGSVTVGSALVFNEPWRQDIAMQLRSASLTANIALPIGKQYALIIDWAAPFSQNGQSSLFVNIGSQERTIFTVPESTRLLYSYVIFFTTSARTSMTISCPVPRFESPVLRSISIKQFSPNPLQPPLNLGTPPGRFYDVTFFNTVTDGDFVTMYANEHPQPNIVTPPATWIKTVASTAPNSTPAPVPNLTGYSRQFSNKLIFGPYVVVGHLSQNLRRISQVLVGAKELYRLTLKYAFSDRSTSSRFQIALSERIIGDYIKINQIQNSVSMLINVPAGFNNLIFAYLSNQNFGVMLTQVALRTYVDKIAQSRNYSIRYDFSRQPFTEKSLNKALASLTFSGRETRTQSNIVVEINSASLQLVSPLLARDINSLVNQNSPSVMMNPNFLTSIFRVNMPAGLTLVAFLMAAESALTNSMSISVSYNNIVLLTRNNFISSNLIQVFVVCESSQGFNTLQITKVDTSVRRLLIPSLTVSLMNLMAGFGRQSGDNLINNPNFDETLTAGVGSSTTILNWNLVSTRMIDGQLRSLGWGRIRVLQFTLSNSFASQAINLPAGPHVLTFQWAAADGSRYQAGVRVAWNKYGLFFVRNVNSVTPISGPLTSWKVLNANRGSNTLQFLPLGNNTLLATISYLSLRRFQVDVEAVRRIRDPIVFRFIPNGNQLIMNPNFISPTFTTNSAINNAIIQSPILGWTSNLNIELARGSVFNREWPIGLIVARLSARVPWIENQIDVEGGRYLLLYNMRRETTDLGLFRTRLDGNIIAEARTNSVASESFSQVIDCKVGRSALRFQFSSTFDISVTIGNFSLFKNQFRPYRQAQLILDSSNTNLIANPNFTPTNFDLTSLSSRVDSLSSWTGPANIWNGRLQLPIWGTTRTLLRLGQTNSMSQTVPNLPFGLYAVSILWGPSLEDRNGVGQTRSSTLVIGLQTRRVQIPNYSGYQNIDTEQRFIQVTSSNLLINLQSCQNVQCVIGNIQMVRVPQTRNTPIITRVSLSRATGSVDVVNIIKQGTFDSITVPTGATVLSNTIDGWAPLTVAVTMGSRVNNFWDVGLRVALLQSVAPVLRQQFSSTTNGYFIFTYSWSSQDSNSDSRWRSLWNKQLLALYETNSKIIRVERFLVQARAGVNTFQLEKIIYTLNGRVAVSNIALYAYR